MKQVTFVLNTTSIRDSIYYIRDLGYRNLSVINKKGHLVGLITRSSIVSKVYDVFWKEYEPESGDELLIIDADTVQSASEITHNLDEELDDNELSN